MFGGTKPKREFNDSIIRCLSAPALASRHVMDIRLKTLATFPNFQRTQDGPQRPSASILMCAQSSFRAEVVGLGGLEPPASPLSGVRSNHLSYRPKSRARLVWWSLSGSNRRPPACKAGALPAELKPHVQSSERDAPADHPCGRPRN